MPGTRSSAATKCISDVPGLEKQVSTPLRSRVWTRLSAPFMGRSFLEVATPPELARGPGNWQLFCHEYYAGLRQDRPTRPMTGPSGAGRAAIASAAVATCRVRVGN